MLLIAAVLFTEKPINITRARWAGFIGPILMIVALFCVGGLHITQPDYKLYFSWPAFIALHVIVIFLFFRCTAGKMTHIDTPAG
jgi:hypothetical protein